jgi:hypothetical protein
VLSELSELSGHGRVLVIVDQPASIGALAIAVARSLGIDVANLPDLAMRRIADLHPEEGKTDARDAYVIADAARTMPHTLRRVGADEDTLAGLTVLAGYGDDLAAQATRVSNRLRDALLHVHPPCNAYWVSGPRGVLDLLAPGPTPTALRALSGAAIADLLAPHSPQVAKTLPAKILLALDAQTVLVPGTAEFGRVVAGVAAQLRDVRSERANLAADLETRLEAPPSCRGPDRDAGRRFQDHHQDPDHRRKRLSVSHRRTPCRLRREPKVLDEMPARSSKRRPGRAGF